MKTLASPSKEAVVEAEEEVVSSRTPRETIDFKIN